MTEPSILVIDVGTSSVRSVRVDPSGTISHTATRATPPQSPADGLMTFDPAILRDAAFEVAEELLAHGPVSGVGLATQRASAVVWDRTTGLPVGPGLGWQDLRTVGRCIELKASGIDAAPNTTATKAEWLLAQCDPSDRRNALVGTIDSWIVWNLTERRHHVSDASNAGVTGLTRDGAWDHDRLEVFGIEVSSLGTIVDSVGVVGDASALSGAPPVASIIGDQQASLVGQGCVVEGTTKITFGTGGMLDQLVTGSTPSQQVVDEGCYPLVAWRHGASQPMAVEAIMLAAAAHVDWLRDGLGLIDRSDEAGPLAASVADAGGVVFVPALSGLGTPHWDHGARGTLLGLTRGTTRAHVVRAVLEGIASRAADMVDAAERASGNSIGELAVDGGLSRDPFFVQCVANATARPVRIASQTEATARGAALLAGVAVGWWPTVEATAAVEDATTRVQPEAPTDRDRWADAVERASGWIPELSALHF